MFERYTESARRTLFFARYEASQSGSRAIETEHLLLGLLRDMPGIVAAVFERAHASPKEVRSDISRRLVRGETFPTSVEIPFSAVTKRVLQRAAEEADRLLHSHIGTEHLLLGLLAEDGESVGASVLEASGIRLADAREVILARTRADVPPHSPAATSVITFSDAQTRVADLRARIADVKRLVRELMLASPDSLEAQRLAEQIEAELDALRAIFD
jgi:ATP-dependent Clp protease ATP-binding subunit ClpC